MSGTIQLGTREDGAPHALPVGAFDYHAQFISPTRRGKTRAMALVLQQLIVKLQNQAAFVVIDPKGDLYDLMKGWAYENALDRRLVLLDVREHEHILGFNPLKPHHSLDAEQQANLQYNILAHVLGLADKQTALLTHEREKWMRNALLALIHAGLTYNEAPQLLEPTSTLLRDTVIPRLPPSETLRDFLDLHQKTTKGNPAALRSAKEQVGHSVIQFRRLTASPVVRRMYASNRTMDFRRLFDDRRILLVRLAPDENVIDLHQQQLLGMQIVNEVIREAMGRRPTDRVQAYCAIDEAGRFASSDVTEVLDQGGSYRLSLFLAHQHCSQLTRPETRDRRFLDSVLTNTHIKFVGGGLAPLDAKEIGDTIHRHLLDPDKPHLATATKRQLQKVVPVTSVTLGVLEAHAHSGGRVSTDAASSSRGRHRLTGASAGELAGTSTTVDPVTGLPTVTTTDARSGGSSSAEGENESDGASHADSDIAMDTDLVAKSAATTTGLAVHPTEVFEEYQPEPLDTQQHRFTSKMIGLPDRHQMSAVRKEPPVVFRVADVPDPKLTPKQVRSRDLRLVRRNPDLYAPAPDIDAMILARQDGILALPPALIPEEVHERNRKYGDQVARPEPTVDDATAWAEAQRARKSKPRKRS